MAPPRTAQSYDESITSASKSALLELTTLLRAYKDAIVLVGGWVPYFLLEQHRPHDDKFIHVGSIDIDFAIDPKKVSPVQYDSIVDLLNERGYINARDRLGNLIPFIFEKEIKSPLDQKPYDIRVDFLTQWKDERPGKHRHLPIQDNLVARKTKGCDAALYHHANITLDGSLPEGGTISVPIQMADLVGCLTMKGIVLGERFKEKDAYDIFTLVEHYKNGPKDVAKELKSFLKEPLLKEAISNIDKAFASRTAHGSVWVADFLGSETESEREQQTTHAQMVVHEMIRLLSN